MKINKLNVLNNTNTEKSNGNNVLSQTNSFSNQVFEILNKKDSGLETELKLAKEFGLSSVAIEKLEKDYKEPLTLTETMLSAEKMWIKLNKSLKFA